MVNLKQLLWNLIYLFGRTPWDTGITPPEVRAVVETGRVQPGRALDLGCGTGTNVIYLAQRGFEVIGVDISSRAVAQARRKIKRAGLAQRAQAHAGDVTRLDMLPVDGFFDFALDIGCFHTVDSSSQARYVAGLAAHMQPGGLYMLYAFEPRASSLRLMGISPEDVRAVFSPAFELLQIDRGQDRGGAGSAWYTFQRSDGKSAGR